MPDRAALSRIAPFATYILFIAAADALLRPGLPGMDLRWLYPLKIGVVIGMLWYWRRGSTDMAWSASVVARHWVIDIGADGKVDWLLVAVRLAGVALVAGIAYGVPSARSRNMWSPIIAHGVTNGVPGSG